MKAITVEPKKPGTAAFMDVPEPDIHEGSILVEAVAVGVCGTDVEISEGKYGWSPAGQDRLILGHESLGRVIDPGPTGGFKNGDLVVGIVRRPDPVPCPNCAVGEWDMCSNGLYTERGIKEIHGFMSERWRIEPEFAIKVDPSLGILGVLLEPSTVVARAPSGCGIRVWLSVDCIYAFSFSGIYNSFYQFYPTSRRDEISVEEIGYPELFDPYGGRIDLSIVVFYPH